MPLQPRHVAVLFRRFVSFGEDVTRAYVDAIEARGIPHLLVGGKAFHGREEVETIRAALAAIEWPDDELSVFATLKGSLFAIDDEQLLEFRHRFAPAPFHPFRIPKELGGNSGSELALSGDAVAHLAADRRRAAPAAAAAPARATTVPVADTIGRLLAETRAHVGFILRPAGEQALANVLHVAELARQYEAIGGISFRGFIDELRTAAASEAAEAPILEEGSDGVRLMTVHKAKGLEFPVVILADLTCNMSRKDASRYLDASRGLCAMKIGGWAPHELHQHEAEEVARDQAEGVRLAYVAATRARDLLVVPALGDDAVGRRMVRSAESRAVSAGGVAAQRGTRTGLSGVQVEGLGAAAAQRRTGRQRHGVSRPAHVRRRAPEAWRRRLLRRLVGSRRAEAGREADVRRPPRRSHRQGRAEERDRRRPRPLRPLAPRARRRARGGGACRRSMVETARDWAAAEFGIQNSEFGIRHGRRSRPQRRGSALGRHRLRSAGARPARAGAVRRGARGARRPRGRQGACARTQRR